MQFIANVTLPDQLVLEIEFRSGGTGFDGHQAVTGKHLRDHQGESSRSEPESEFHCNEQQRSF